MTKVLFHSYHYPPIGGSGAQRPLNMTRYLPELGYEPIVVTSGGATADRWAPEDRTLSLEIPAGVEVFRVAKSAEPETSRRWRGRAERWLGTSSPWARHWVGASIRLSLQVGVGADVIYVWMQPYASAEAGMRLSKKLAKPWVADLGDPWALDEMMVYPTAVHRRSALRVMGRCLSTAEAIVMSTPEAVTRLLETFPELRGRHVVAIPNGFDANDFAAAPPAPPDSTFRIVHTGYLHTELGREHRHKLPLRRLLGGSSAGLDILTRSHVYLIEAIDRLLARDPALAQTLELHLAGVLTDADREVAARCPVVKLHGYVTHAESVALMRSANLLFLPMQNLPRGIRATIVPGKTYEYLASETPILGAVPDGDARDILQDAGNAILCRPDDVEGMVAALRTQIDGFRNQIPRAAPRKEVVARFEYRYLARRLAGVFDTVLEDRA